MRRHGSRGQITWSKPLRTRAPQDQDGASCGCEINIRSSRIFARARNRTCAVGLTCGEDPPQEKKMRILSVVLGAAAALAVTAPVAADPGPGRVQLAQAQDSGMQSGSGTGARQQGSSGSQQGSSGMSQQGSAGQREGGSAATRQSSGGGAAISQTQGTSRTTVRQRSEGARVSVRGGSRTAVGVRSAASDDAVFIKRKKARRYVYSEPSTTVIRKKKRFAIHEPSSSVIVHKRHAGGVAVGGGTSTRTTVRSGTVRGSSTTRESVGAGAGARQGASGQGNVGAGGSSQGSGQTGRSPSGGGASGSSGGSESTSGRQ